MERLDPRPTGDPIVFVQVAYVNWPFGSAPLSR